MLSRSRPVVAVLCGILIGCSAAPSPEVERPAKVDCAGTQGGAAFLDPCNQCVGGSTGKTACTQDCAGVFGGQAAMDQCGQCVGGTTAKTACTQDCAGVFGGQAAIDHCGQCAGGTTAKTACAQDCAGVWGGQALVDQCGQCVSGTTGRVACAQDCAGVWGGQALVDHCGQCVEGNTGRAACAQDCAGVWGGQAVLDHCGQCVDGTTGRVACVQDCAGVWGGQAAVDQCGQCAGGTTGKVACAQDCAGVWGGTAVVDHCGQCVEGTTGRVACLQDCAGVWGGVAQTDACNRCTGGTTGRTACSTGVCPLGPGETVQSLVDNPSCTVIALPDAIYRGPIRVDLARMNGKRSVEVRGTTRDGTIFQGGVGQVFWIEAGASLRLGNLTISGNNIGLAGAAIDNLGAASLDGVAVTNNTGSVFGAIVNAGQMEIRASVISGNRLTTTSAFGMGGGIYNTGSLFIGATSITANASSTDGLNFGGGLCNDGGSVIIEDSDIGDNTVSNRLNVGGSMEGAGIFSSLGQLDIARTSIHHNHNTNVGFGAHGGGISAWGSIVKLAGGDVSFNEAIAQDDSFGAGIYLEQHAQLQVDGTIIEGNVGKAGLDLGGAAVMAHQASPTITSSRMANNRLEVTGALPAQITGGLLEVREGTLTVTGGQMVGNSMTGGFIQGGLIRVNELTSPSEVDESLDLQGIEIAGNVVTTADEVNGGLISALRKLTLKDCSVHSNTVHSGANSGLSGGLVHYVERRDLPGSPTPGEVTVASTRMDDNTVTAANGVSGGVLYLAFDRGGPVAPALTASTFLRNSVSSAAGGVRGGVFYLDEARHAAISDCMVSSNIVNAGVDGGSSLFPVAIQGGVIHHSFTGGGSLSPEADGEVDLVRTDVSQNRIGSALATDSIHGGVLSLDVAFHFGAHLLTWAATNATFSGNVVQARSAVDGGFVNVFNRQGSDVSIALSNVTLALNQSAGPLGSILDFGPPVSDYRSAVVQLRNTILAQNAAPGSADCPLQGPLTAIASSGYNLLGDMTACAGLTPASTDSTGVDPLFGVYGDNGGPVYSLPIQAASPAVDGGDPAGCVDSSGAALSTDQRGLPRPAGPRCDVGAYELQGP